MFRLGNCSGEFWLLLDLMGQRLCLGFVSVRLDGMGMGWGKKMTVLGGYWGLPIMATRLGILFLFVLVGHLRSGMFAR
jgi:hypothetical protein